MVDEPVEATPEELINKHLDAAYSDKSDWTRVENLIGALIQSNILVLQKITEGVDGD